jgi:phosphonate transport system substrate-binding protein
MAASYVDDLAVVVAEAVQPAAVQVDRQGQLLLAMSADDPEVRPLLELEGLRAWLPGRTDGYRALEAAVDQAGFYDATGRLTATGYQP